MNETKETKDMVTAEDKSEKMPSAKKREIIKTLIIVFLAIMLVLTFFSNTIMNKSLPEISTETVSSGKLTERIRGNGVIESNQSYEVTADAGKTIEKVHIKSGKEVKKGDVLFTINNVDSEKLEAAETELDAAKLEYETALLKDPLDYSAENQGIKVMRDELSSLIAKRDAAKVNDSNAAAARAEYNSNKSEQARLSDVQISLEAAVKALGSDALEEVPPEYIGGLQPLYDSFAAADAEYNDAYELYKKAVESGGNVEVAKADSDAKKAVRDSAKAAYDEAKNSRRSELVSQLSETKTALADINSAIEAYTSQYGEGGANTYDTLAAEVVAKQNELQNAIIELDKKKKADNNTNRKEALTLESQKKKLDKLQEKFDKLKEEATSTEIKSKYSGVVSSVMVQPDDVTAEGSPLAVIDLVDEGFTVQIMVEAEKTKKIKKGAEAEIVNNYNNDITAVLSEIKTDAQSGSRNKILVFDVTGNAVSGERLDLSIPCGSGTYDAIVPRSAVKTDKNETFVLVVRSKQTPLGNRYYAERVNVQEEARDEVSSAVSGGIERSDHVITASSKPINPGDQVRMKDK